MKKTVNSPLASLPREPYAPPFTRSIIVKVSGVLCDSITNTTPSFIVDSYTPEWED